MSKQPAPPSRRTRSAQALLRVQPSIIRRLRKAKLVALFLDFDGTLAPLTRDPQDVWLNQAMRRVLRRLTALRRVRIWIISGRRRDDVKRRVAVPGIRYVGLHGWERGNREIVTRNLFPSLSEVKTVVSRRLEGMPGIRIEDKRLSFAVHYRSADASVVRQSRIALEQSLRPFKRDLQVLKGKKVWEVLPVEMKTKGDAVRSILAAQVRPCFPIYLGDDTTDELAFRFLRDGLTIRVGYAPKTHARHRLPNPREVRAFLEALESEMSG